MYRNIYLKKGKEESLGRFHPWIFSGALAHADDGIEEGDVVRVITSDGGFIALGHYQGGSIAVRILSFGDVVVDKAFWTAALGSALSLRRRLGLADSPRSDAYRLVHGEGDFLPGLIIDVYGKTAVMQAHSVGMHNARNELAAVLVDVMGGRIDNVYYKSETTLPFKAGVEHDNGFIVGGSDDNIAQENGLRFYVDWLKGQKTGFFVDQRDNRALLEEYSGGRRVLNMFCYTGGFSVYALRGGASLVHSVDSSAKAIELTRRNVELNFPADGRHEAFCEDAFKYLDSAGNNYDLMPEPQGSVEDPARRRALHVLMQPGGHQRQLPQRRLYGGGPGPPPCAHPAPAPPAGRPSDKHLPSRGRVSQRTCSLC